MTQLEAAKKNIITDEMRLAAKHDEIDVQLLLDNIKNGLVVLPKNINHNFTQIRGIGKNLSTKINANIGTSGDLIDKKIELEKLIIAQEAGADSIMDLSTGGNLLEIRRLILENTNVMLGAVPIYSYAKELLDRGQKFSVLNPEELLKSIEKECENGLDYITVHCGLTLESLKILKYSKRLCDIVSRGGSIIANYMKTTKKQNPLYEYFDDLLKIAAKFDVTLSLGDSLRPGSIFDSTDDLQINELITLSTLAKRAYEKNVQVMIEGPGHVPLNDIKLNIELEKKLCNGAPFYVLGPLPTDAACPYDHIASTVGASIAAASGADFICYVTPAEHLGLPDKDDVYQGVVAAKIAAHIGDLSKGIKKAINRDMNMSKYRRDLNWEMMLETSLFSKDATLKHKESASKACTMCGQLCVFKINKN